MARRGYDQVSFVVHPACVLLAVGSAGAGTLPSGVAAAIAIPHRRHRCRWRT